MPTTTGVATEFISFTRASNATVVDSNGLIDWAAHNLLLASEQFDASNWSKNAATVAANAIAAPNGTTTADTITSTGSGSYVLQSYSAISGTVTVSVFAKPGTNSSVVLRTAQAGNGYETSFTLSGSGTAGTPTIIGTGGTVSGMTASISSLADSWYLCTIRFAETGLGNVFIMQTATSGTIHLWGAHLYRSDLGGMQANTSAYPMYNPTTPKTLLGFTEAFSDAYWTKGTILAFGSGSVADAVVGPNGLQTADKITPAASSGYQNVRRSATITSPHTISVYAKSAGYTNLRISDFANGALYASFNLATGAVIAGSTGGSAFVSATISPVGSDGWYRCAITTNTTTSTAYTFTFSGYPTGATIDAYGATFTGDGTSGVYLWGAQLSDSASLDPYSPNHFTAPSAAAYYGPRRDFDPVTLACKGLLVEEQRANLLVHSAAFDNAAWTLDNTGAVNPVVTVNYAAAPDGTLTADRIVFDKTGGTFSRIYQALAATSGVYTFSVWMKKTTAGTANVGIRIDVTGVNCAVTNTWARFSVTMGSAAAGQDAQILLFDSIAGNDETADILVWGAQVELGSFATSYIPTTTASATRSADVAQVSTAAFPYSATEGTLVISADTYDVGSSAGLIASLSAGLTSNSVLVGLFSNKTSLSVTVGGSPQAFLQPSGTVSTNTVFKAGGAFATNSFIASSNGTLSTEDPSGSVPTGITTLGIGIISTVIPINGHIRQLTYLPRRVTNAELQTRTA